MPATKGNAQLTAQDADAIRAVIAEMQDQIGYMQRLINEGFKSDGISNNASEIADRIHTDYSNNAQYNPLAGLKSERWGTDGDTACVSGSVVETATEHLDEILTELYEGTYPGFVPAE